MQSLEREVAQIVINSHADGFVSDELENPLNSRNVVAMPKNKSTSQKN